MDSTRNHHLIREDDLSYLLACRTPRRSVRSGGGRSAHVFQQQSDRADWDVPRDHTELLNLVLRQMALAARCISRRTFAGSNFGRKRFSGRRSMRSAGKPCHPTFATSASIAAGPCEKPRARRVGIAHRLFDPPARYRRVISVGGATLRERKRRRLGDCSHRRHFVLVVGQVAEQEFGALSDNRRLSGSNSPSSESPRNLIVTQKMPSTSGARADARAIRCSGRERR